MILYFEIKTSWRNNFFLFLLQFQTAMSKWSRGERGKGCIRGVAFHSPLRSFNIRGAMLTGNKWAISNNYAEVEQLFDNPLRSAPWSSTERCWPFKTWNFHLEGILYFLKNQTAISNSYVEVKPGERGIGCIRGVAPLSVMWSDVDLPSLFLLGTNGFFFSLQF